MAIWRHSIGQTAVNTAATVTAALIGVGEIPSGEVSEEFGKIRDETFAYLNGLADQDDAAYEAAGPKTETRPASGGAAKKTGGAKRASSGPRKGPNLEDSRTLELNFGAFEGVKLGDLLDISAEEADADYAYGDGERSGRDYLAWLASDKCSRDFVRVRARLIAEAEGINYEAA